MDPIKTVVAEVRVQRVTTCSRHIANSASMMTSPQAANTRNRL